MEKRRILDTLPQRTAVVTRSQAPVKFKPQLKLRLNKFFIPRLSKDIRLEKNLLNNQNQKKILLPKRQSKEKLSESHVKRYITRASVQQKDHKETTRLNPSESLREIRYKKRKIQITNQTNVSEEKREDYYDDVFEAYVEIEDVDETESVSPGANAGKNIKIMMSQERIPETEPVLELKSSFNKINQIANMTSECLCQENQDSDPSSIQNQNSKIEELNPEVNIAKHVDLVILEQDENSKEFSQLKTEASICQDLKQEEPELVQKSRPGDYALGDKPLAILKMQYEEVTSDLVFVMKWKKTEPNTNLETSLVTRSDIIKYDPLFLVYFYETHLEFPRYSEFESKDLFRIPR